MFDGAGTVKRPLSCGPVLVMHAVTPHGPRGRRRNSRCPAAAAWPTARPQNRPSSALLPA